MSDSPSFRDAVKRWWTLRNALILTFRLLLFIAGGSLAYLLFIFGHYDVREVVTYGQSDVTPKYTILLVAAVAGTSALLAGMLQWIGLPADPNAKGRKNKAKK